MTVVSCAAQAQLQGSWNKEIDLPYGYRPEADPARDRSLLAIAFERVEQPAYEGGMNLRRVMETSSALDDDVHLCQDAQGWLLISALDLNPFVRRDGHLSVDRYVLAWIDRIRTAGIVFDQYAVVHVLPPGYSPHRRIRRQLRRAGSRRGARAGRLPNVTSLVASAASVAHSLRELCRASGLDPVLLGGIVHPVSCRVLWYEVARWGDDGCA